MRRNNVNPVNPFVIKILRIPRPILTLIDYRYYAAKNT